MLDGNRPAAISSAALERQCFLKASMIVLR
jgi:hypothetical protein